MKIFCFLFLIFIKLSLIFSKKYKYYSYDKINEIFKELSLTCPQYIKIDTSQNRYNLPSGGICGASPCQNLIVFMTDFNTMNAHRAQMYISGLLHGDEVIGATTLTELALYMCNEKLEGENKWVFDILKKVYFVFTPFTNAYGYSRESREDFVVYNNGQTGIIDPNRDFPYFNLNGDSYNKCMLTITARTINELFREHIFISAITFHGGANSIGYPWGNNIHLVNSRKGTEAPDRNALMQLGEILKSFTSSKMSNDIPDYNLGDMNEVTYPIDGGMEDWGYAGSWENINYIHTLAISPIKQCNPYTFSGYNQNNTIYESSSLRALIYLVETADMKKPYQNQLGSDENLFNLNGYFYGHIARNIRLVIAAADMTWPSIRIDEVKHNEENYSFDFSAMGCLNLEEVTINKFIYKDLYKNAKSINTNEFKDIFIKHYQNEPRNATIVLFPNNKNNILPSPMETDIIQRISNPTCFWKDFLKSNSTFRIDTKKDINFNINTNLALRPGFLNYIENNSSLCGVLFYVNGINPDSSWQAQNRPDPIVPPQSLSVNARSNTSFSMENDNFLLGSASHFSSNPVLLLENGMLFEINDMDALFLSSNELDLQIHSDFIIRSIINVNFAKDSKFLFGLRKSSQFEFKLNLNLFIYNNYTQYQEDFNSNTYEQVDSIDADLLMILKPKQIKMKLLGENHYLEKVCHHYVGIFKTFSFIKCEISFPGIDINMNFIRNKLISSLVNIELNEHTNIIGAINLFNRNFTGRYINSDNLYCTSYLERNLLTNIMVKKSDLKEYKISNTFSNGTNYIIKMQKLTKLNWNISFTLLNNDNSTGGVSILFSNGLTVLFTSDELSSNKFKQIRLPAQNLNIIGTNVYVYIFDKDKPIYEKINFENASLKHNMFYCTLLESNIYEKEDMDKFFDFSKFNAIDDNNQDKEEDTETDKKTDIDTENEKDDSNKKSDKNDFIIWLCIIIISALIIIVIFLLKRKRMKMHMTGYASNPQYTNINFSKSFPNNSHVDLENIDL